MPTTILIIALVLLLFIAAIVLLRTLRMMKALPEAEIQPGLEVNAATAAMLAVANSSSGASINFTAANDYSVNVSSAQLAASYMTTVQNAMDTVNQAMADLGSLMARMTIKEEAATQNRVQGTHGDTRRQEGHCAPPAEETGSPDRIRRRIMRGSRSAQGRSPLGSNRIPARPLDAGLQRYQRGCRRQNQKRDLLDYEPEE